MADFCLECGVTVFGEDFGDMANMTTKEQTENGVYAYALCEGCGFTLVDHTGACVRLDCDPGPDGHRHPRYAEKLREWYISTGAISGPRTWPLRLRWALLGSPWYPGLWHRVRLWWNNGPYYWVRGKKPPRDFL